MKEIEKKIQDKSKSKPGDKKRDHKRHHKDSRTHGVKQEDGDGSEMPQTQTTNKTNSTYTYGNQKRKKLEMSEEELKKSAQTLIREMQDAVERDNEANEKGRPALKKLLLLDHVCQELRRIAIQHFFLESGGCTVLGEWLDVLPDGTYPNLSVVQEMLGCLDSLEI